MDDATDDTAVVNTLHTPRIRRQQRLKPSILLIAQPEMIRHPQLPQFGSLNHLTAES
jgi:hypothetical protein